MNQHRLSSLCTLFGVYIMLCTSCFGRGCGALMPSIISSLNIQHLLSSVPLTDKDDPLCHLLTLHSCPEKDTVYLCTFQSDALGSVQTTVTVSVLQGKDGKK